jgi:acyl carrier protein
MQPTSVLQLCAEILEVEDLRPEDNFFELGGNSMLALSLIVETKARWNVDIRLIDLIRTETIQDIADLVERASIR